MNHKTLDNKYTWRADTALLNNTSEDYCHLERDVMQSDRWLPTFRSRAASIFRVKI
jgi:hypothetical protein